jgi:hypothetical protein
MSRANFARITGLLIFCLSTNAPSFAQQTFSPSSVAPNPVVEQMLRATPDGEPLVELRGYVGPSTPETVRLYVSLSLSQYLEIPRSAIVYLLPEGDPKTGPVKLYVRGTATVVSANRLIASSAASSQQAIALPGARPRDLGECYTAVVECGWVPLACLAAANCLAGAAPPSR